MACNRRASSFKKPIKRRELLSPRLTELIEYVEESEREGEISPIGCCEGH